MELFTPEIKLIYGCSFLFWLSFFILAKFAWPAILKGVNARNKYIDDSLLAAKQARDELARVRADGQAIVEEARKEQSRILAEAAKSKGFDSKRRQRQSYRGGFENHGKCHANKLHEKEDAIRQIRREVATLSG